VVGKLRLITAGDIMLHPVVPAMPEGLTVNRARAMLGEGEYRGLVLMEGSKVTGACPRGYLADCADGEVLLDTIDYCRHVRVIPPDATLEDIVRTRQPGLTPIHVITDATGQPAGIIDPDHLIRWLAKELYLTDNRLAAVVDTVNEAITIIDCNEDVVCWNSQAEKLYDIPAAQIIGQPIKSFFTDLVATQVLHENREVRNSYHQPCEGTHVLINAGPIRLKDTLIGSISAERDITELVQLHQDLSRANSQVRLLEKEIKNMNGRHDPFKDIMGHSRRLAEAVAVARRVAGTNASVLIRGESGTGKDLFAEAMHKESGRSGKPFITINCGAIPPTLFESELFGYQGGAFTGADRKGKPGKFEMADGGTVFLDEIGELPPEMQVKLLRVIQQNVFYRVGGSQPIKVDVRIIAATHRNLEDMLAKRQFREDLYYRLNVVALEMPPLRERKEDIPELVYTFINEFSHQHQRNISRVAPEVMSILLGYSWPGNVRELRNILERMVILVEGDTINVEHLPKTVKKQTPKGREQETSSTLADLTRRNERDIIARALRQAKGNKAKAAKALGIPRSTLYYRMKTLKLDIE